MRKLLLFLMSIGGIAINISAQNPTKREITTLKKLNLRGEIKNMELYQYRVKEKFDVVIKDELFDKEVYAFDISGHAIFHKHSLGVSYKKSELCYIDISRNKDSVITFLNTEMAANKQYRYDSTGKLLWIRMFKYDNNYNLIETNKYNADGSRQYRDVFEYDIKNQLIKGKRYGENGVLIKFEVYLYDAYGRCIKKSDFNKNGDLDSYTTYKFDLMNNLTSEIYISISSGYSSKELYEYDAFSNLTKETSTQSGIDVIDKKPWNRENESTYSYEFDSNQNWVKRTKFNNKINTIPEAVEITERKIIYFK